jgi:hypothetical protein
MKAPVACQLYGNMNGPMREYGVIRKTTFVLLHKVVFHHFAADSHF